MAASSAMMPEMIAGGGIAGDDDHIETHRADRGHGLELFNGEGTGGDSVDHAGILRYRDKGAGQAADPAGRHDAALFDCVVEHGKGGSGAMGAALFQTHLLEDMGHRVAHRRGGSQGQVHNAEGHAQTAAGFGAHQLTHTGDLEGGLLDDVGDFVNGQGLVHAWQGRHAQRRGRIRPH